MPRPARIAGAALGLMILAAAHPTHAQFANMTGNVAGTVGQACVSATNDYAWPDTNGNILKCVSNLWTIQGTTATAAGSTGYVQFNNGGTLAGSANLFWNNTNGYLGIGTTAPVSSLQVMANTTAGSGHSGAITLTNATTTTKEIYIGYDNSANAGIIQSDNYGTGGMNLSLNPSGGNVGIGTTNPAATLNVVSPATTVLVWSTASGSTGPWLTLKDYGYSAWNMWMWANDNHQLRIDGPSDLLLMPTGNVGIGVLRPKNLLAPLPKV
jgi:hypothetical protein